MSTVLYLQIIHHFGPVCLRCGKCFLQIFFCVCLRLRTSLIKKRKKSTQRNANTQIIRKHATTSNNEQQKLLLWGIEDLPNVPGIPQPRSLRKQHSPGVSSINIRLHASWSHHLPREKQNVYYGDLVATTSNSQCVWLVGWLVLTH